LSGLSGASQVVWMPNQDGLAVSMAQTVSLVSVARPPANQAGRPQALQPQTVSAAVAPNLLAGAQNSPVLAWVNQQTEVQVWRQGEGRPPETVGGGDQPVTGLAVSDDGNRVAYITYDGRLHVMRIDAAADIQSLGTPAPAPTWLTNLSFSPDGKQIGGTAPAGFSVYILDANSGEVLRELDWTDSPTPALYGAFFSHDWQRLAWVSQGLVQIMDVTTGKKGVQLSHADAVTALAWSPDSTQAATASAMMQEGDLSPSVQVWDVRTGELLRAMALGAPVQSMAYALDGRLAVLDTAGNVQIFP
jgi:WD40 repeat protein